MRKFAILSALAFMISAMTFNATPSMAYGHPMMRRCPRGFHWVPAHRGPHHRWIAAGCRR